MNLCQACRDCADSFHLGPLGELVHGDVEVAIAPWRPRKRAQDIQPPDCEWPFEGYSLQTSSWLMDLLGMELAGLASLYQFDNIIERSGPIESTAERLANEGLRR